MNKQISYYSIYEFRQLIHNEPRLINDTCIISISDSFEEAHKMHDFLERMNPVADRYYDYFKDSESTELGCVDKQKAQRLFEFIYKNKECTKFIIHCNTGTLRSAAVAKFISEQMFGQHLDVDEYSKYIYNELLVAKCEFMHKEEINSKNKENRSIAECYDVLYNGDKLTDTEVIDLMNAFKDAADATFKLGNRFEIAFKEAIIRYEELYKIAKARNIL